MVRSRGVIVFRLILPALFALLLPHSASALMTALSVEALTTAADQVVRGRVLQSQAAWSADGRTIVTRVQVAVDEQVVGGSGTQIVTVQVPGGEIDGLALRISDTPTLTAGEAVVLFLKAPQGATDGLAAAQAQAGGGGSGQFTLVGKAQGVYTIGEAGTVSKGRYLSATAAPDSAAQLGLDDLLTRIRAAAADK